MKCGEGAEDLTRIPISPLMSRLIVVLVVDRHLNIHEILRDFTEFHSSDGFFPGKFRAARRGIERAAHSITRRASFIEPFIEPSGMKICFYAVSGTVPGCLWDAAAVQ